MVKKSAFILFALLLLTLPVSAQDGYSVDCGNGVGFDNGIEIQLVETSSRITYRATAVGVGDFDPVLAVFDSDGNGTCNDDGEALDGYGVDLPTTGEVGASNLSSQLDFEGTNGLMSVVVGGYGNATGEFILVIEGLTITGDESFGGVPVSLNVTAPMLNSGVPLTVYMVSLENELDTKISKVDGQGTTLTDGDTPVECDDAGSASCYGDSQSLDGSVIGMERGSLNANNLDSMLNLTLDGVTLSSDATQNYFNFVLGSFNGQQTGEFVVAFHVGIGAPSGNGGGSGGNPPPRQGGADATPTPGSGGGNPPPRQGQGGGSSSSDLPEGLTVECDGGVSFSNGVEVVISQMRSGFTYTATAVGLNGFDPVLAVLDSNRNGLCNDDDVNAARYAASLPTTGNVSASNFSSQVRFDQNSAETFADVSLVVGGFGNQTGEFLLILEGMAVTSGDNAGDPFLVGVTQQMLNSGVPLSVYMLTRGTSGVDPYIYMLDGDGNPLQDADGNDVFCDDAGNSSVCFGNSVQLDNYNVTINTGTLPGWQYDAMLSLPLDAFNFPAGANFLNYMMTSFGDSEGQYLLVFHMGTSN